MKPTIWMIIPSFYPLIGGAENQVRNISKELISLGWSVNILTRRHSPSHPDGLCGRDMIDGFPVYRLDSRGTSKVGSIKFVLGGLLFLLQNGRHSIYHAHDVGAAGWLAVIARFLFNGRAIVKLRSGYHYYQKFYSSNLARWQFLILLHLADHIVVVNSEMESFLINRGISTTKVTLITNSIDTNYFYPASPKGKATLREKLGLPFDKTIVLYVGRLQYLKGVDILLNAWVLMPEYMRLTSQLLLVGDGPERESIRQLININSVEESVLIIGEQQNVRDYYHAADIFTLASRTEGQSNALLEAMACGLPVVASCVGGTPEIVSEGKNGLLFETENTSQYASKLATLITSPVIWMQMGMNARDTVLAQANIVTTTHRICDLYQELM